MSFFNRLFKIDTAPPSESQAPEVLFLGDYAELAPSDAPPPPGGIYGMLHIDFKHVYPHVSCASQMVYRPENPSGFRLKILSVRHEPSGDIECVYLQEMFDGGKIVIRRFKVAPQDFDAVEELVRDLESQHATKFVRVDFRNARNSAEFKEVFTGGKPPPLPSSQPPPLPGSGPASLQIIL